MPADFAPKVNHHDSASVEHGWFETLVVRASPASSPFPLEAQKVPPPWGSLHFVFDASLLFPLGVQKVQPLWASLHFVPDADHHDFVIVERMRFESSVQAFHSSSPSALQVQKGQPSWASYSLHLQAHQ